MRHLGGLNYLPPVKQIFANHFQTEHKAMKAIEIFESKKLGLGVYRCKLIGGQSNARATKSGLLMIMVMLLRNLCWQLVRIANKLKGDASYLESSL